MRSGSLKIFRGILALLGASAVPAQDAEPARVKFAEGYLPNNQSEGPLPVTVYPPSVLVRIGQTPVKKPKRKASRSPSRPVKSAPVAR